jgi:hypothetical protein
MTHLSYHVISVSKVLRCRVDPEVNIQHPITKDGSGQFHIPVDGISRFLIIDLRFGHPISFLLLWTVWQVVDVSLSIA